MSNSARSVMPAGIASLSTPGWLLAISARTFAIFAFKLGWNRRIIWLQRLAHRDEHHRRLEEAAARQGIARYQLLKVELVCRDRKNSRVETFGMKHINLTRRIEEH